MSDKQSLDERCELLHMCEHVSHIWSVNEHHKKLLEQKLFAHYQYLLEYTEFDYSRRRRALRAYCDQCTVDLGLKLKDRAMQVRLDNLRRRVGGVKPPPPVSSSRLSRSASAVPPKEACYLLALFLAKADREVIPGDLEEEFTTKVLPKHGARRARLWFWKQTVSAIVRRNPACRWLLVSGLGWVAELIFRKMSS
jgi:hypothetical protein